MAKLWDKYLVQRRDGTVPEWPWLVMGARDPIAPAALRAYADEADRLGYDPKYVDDLRQLVMDWEKYRAAHGDGDPDAPRHRTDDPDVVNRIPSTGGTVKFRGRE